MSQSEKNFVSNPPGINKQSEIVPLNMEKSDSFNTKTLKCNSSQLNEWRQKCCISMLVGNSIGLLSGVVVLVAIICYKPMAIVGLITGTMSATLCSATGFAKWYNRRQVSNRLEEYTLELGDERNKQRKRIIDDDFSNQIKILVGISLIFLRGGSIIVCILTESNWVKATIFGVAFFGVILDGVCFGLNFKILNTKSKLGIKVNEYVELLEKKIEIPSKNDNPGSEIDELIKHWNEKTILHSIVKLVQFNLINGNENSSILKTDVINFKENLKEDELNVWKAFVNLNISHFQERIAPEKQENDSMLRINALPDILSYVESTILKPDVKSVSKVAAKTIKQVAKLTHKSQCEWLEFLFVTSPPGNFNNNGNEVIGDGEPTTSS